VVPEKGPLNGCDVVVVVSMLWMTSCFFRNLPGKSEVNRCRLKVIHQVMAQSAAKSDAYTIALFDTVILDA